MRDLLDRALGKYIILEEIGRGGMGAVYKARDVELDRIVAMKVLSPYLVGEPHLVQRFMREARLAANLDHPNIVAIYDIGGEGGYYYFVMKYLDGRSLKEIIAQRGPLPLDEVVSIVRQLASALDYAHQQNLIHRDVKPGNVIVGSDGHVTLTDFGLAKVVESMKLTASGETLGTLEYMSPEQARGEASPASDIYSLGVMTYEMLAGRLPFQGSNQATLLYQHLHEPPPPLCRWNPAVPPEVEQVVLKAMAKEPAERYATAGEMARELERAARRAIFPGPTQRPAEPKPA
ncbi:MAG: protein kinase domain-containing protein, partial [Chloroflexia bacterium]